MDTKAAQRQLVTLITQHLSESIPVTRILTYKPDKNGSVTGRFESFGRVFNFAFNGNDVRYKPSGNMDSDLFSEYYLQRFDAAPATLRGTRTLPKCTSKSYSCKGAVGVRCLPLTQHCKIGNSAIGNERLGKIKSLAKTLAASGEDSSKVEAARAKIIEGRLALAAKNRANRQPKKSLEPIVKSKKENASKSSKLPKEEMLTSKYPKLSNNQGEMFSKTTQINGDTITTSINEDIFQDYNPPPTTQIINIYVNGAYFKEEGVGSKNGLKLALASREHVREYVKNAANGMILANSPYQDDGFGDQRARLYEKAGFSPIDKKTGMMYSIVSDGKNIPITLKEIMQLRKTGHINN